MNKPYQSWQGHINWQLDFYKKGTKKNRVDDEFDWEWLTPKRDKMFRLLKPFVNFVAKKSNLTMFQWFDENSKLLWNSRQTLNDELSKYLFDCHLLVKILGYQKYYYPRINFDDFILIQSEKDFADDLPKDYAGLPLYIYDIKLNNGNITPGIAIVTAKLNIHLLNNYRQYFVNREGRDLSPSEGEVVFDCGACIGDTALIFSALVGASGEVHLFDPVPLHIRFCNLQASLNPRLKHTLHINNLAVSNITKDPSGTIMNPTKIVPGMLLDDNFKTTTLDDYVSQKNLRRVDYIKMDIEGTEIAALQGAFNIIHNFKPRLAISTYHKLDDLWTIPEIIKRSNPKYKLYFGHHSPMQWESVYYAV